MSGEVSNKKPPVTNQLSNKPAVSKNAVKSKFLKVRENMTVADIQNGAPKAQAMAAHLFDLDGNGIYDAKEAARFNQHSIYRTQNSLTLYNTKTNTAIAFQYENENDLKEVEARPGYDPDPSGGYAFKESKGDYSGLNLEEIKDAKITYDIIKNEVSVEGGTSYEIDGGYLTNFTISNHGSEWISSHTNDKTNIKNVYGTGRDGKATLFRGKDTILNVDNNSKIDIEY